MSLIANVVDWWGLSGPQTLVVVALILVVVDIFIQSDVATHVAYILISIAVAWLVPVQVLFRVLVGLAAWGFLVYIHYSLWRKFATHFVNRVIAPTKFRAGARGLIGSTGVVKEIDGRKMVSLQGDLWPYEGPADMPPGSTVEVIGERGGVLKIMLLEKGEK